MKRLAILVFICCPAALPQAWTGILSAPRAADWHLVGVPGGIPTRNTICSTIAGGASEGTIEAAIQACPSGQVVLLQAGTYAIAGIDFQGKSNVTVRGADSRTVIIKPPTQYGLDCFGVLTTVCLDNYPPVNYVGAPTNTANWTAGYAQGATSITIDNAANIVANQTVLILDQCDDGFSGATCSTGTAADTGNVFDCQAVGVCASVDGGGGGPGGAARNNRTQEQMVLVTNVSGSGPYTITISPGLYMPNWRTGQVPQAWWANSESTGSGIENVTIDDTNATYAGGYSSVTFFNVYGDWATGIRTINTGRAHFTYYLAAHCTVANNYLYGTQNSESRSYGVEDYGGSDNLTINNIMEHIVSPTVQAGPDEGNVYAYNYAIDDYYSNFGNGAWFQVANWLHAAGSAMDLFEGNQGGGFTADPIHGTHNFTTLFRNYYIGNQASCAQVPCSVQTAPVNVHYARYFNYIGDVFGQASYHTVYQELAVSPTTGGTFTGWPIYVVGFSGLFDGYDSTTGPNDTYGPTSMMRWGNYDVVNNATRFVSGEVPSGLTDGYANSVPASHCLPNSFFLTSSSTCPGGASQPAWWATSFGTPTWPAIGPDVTGGNVPNVGGFANNIPAQLVWQNEPVDTNYQTFYNVTGGTCSAGIVTVTVGAHSVTEGEVRVTGLSPANWNVPNGVQLTGWTSTTISYPASCSGSYSSGGVLAWPNIRLFTPNDYGASQAAAPVILPVSGAYNTSQTVTMSCASPSPTIYYTTNGTTPTHGSSVYSSGFTQTIPATVKAICASSGLSDSPVTTNIYTVPGIGTFINGGTKFLGGISIH